MPKLQWVLSPYGGATPPVITSITTNCFCCGEDMGRCSLENVGKYFIKLSIREPPTGPKPAFYKIDLYNKSIKESGFLVAPPTHGHNYYYGVLPPCTEFNISIRGYYGNEDWSWPGSDSLAEWIIDSCLDSDFSVDPTSGYTGGALLYETPVSAALKGKTGGCAASRFRLRQISNSATPAGKNDNKACKSGQYVCFHNTNCSASSSGLQVKTADSCVGRNVWYLRAAGYGQVTLQPYSSRYLK